jgi:hypothetical protein
MNRQKVIVIGIELAQFLFAMDPIKAFIKIQGQMATGKLSQYRSSIAMR